MKRPSTYYAPICAWLTEQQKTHALEGLTYRQIASRAQAALNMDVCASSIETLAKQLGYKYRKLKQPDLLEDRSPTDSARIKELLCRVANHDETAKLQSNLMTVHTKMLCAICNKLGIEAPK